MNRVRTNTIKTIRGTVTYTHNNEYTRIEVRYRGKSIGEYELEHIEWRDMFNKTIAIYKWNNYYKQLNRTNNDTLFAIPKESEDVIKFKELERQYKIMKALEIEEDNREVSFEDYKKENYMTKDYEQNRDKRLPNM